MTTVTTIVYDDGAVRLDFDRALAGDEPPEAVMRLAGSVIRRQPGVTEAWIRSLEPLLRAGADPGDAWDTHVAASGLGEV